MIDKTSSCLTEDLIFRSKIRNPKHEAKHLTQEEKYETMTKIAFLTSLFRSFCHLVFEFVSDFGFLYSDLA